MLLDRYGSPLTSADLFRQQANKAVVGPGANVYANGISIAGMTPQRYMEQAQAMYYSNPWIRSAEGLVSRKLATSDWKVVIDNETDDIEEEVKSGPAVEWLEAGSPLQNLSRSKLWQITTRHTGVCNNAFWYVAPNGDPSDGSIYINPCRMTPVPTEAGYLSHWLLDADPWGNDGVRFEKDEILWFQLEPADVGFFGHGLVYSALLKASLSQAADRHALQVLETGGRMQGIISPTKDDYLSDTQFQSMQREMRNVTELDDSAKRMVLLRKSIEFTRTTQTQSELELTVLMRTTKEDIYEIWGVPRSQTGGMTEVGMNSGDRQSYEEAALQQNAIHPRAVMFEETIKPVLQRWDPRYELEIDEPEFDDERPLFEMLKMSEFAPLSRNERRAIVKLPPIKGGDGDIIEQNPSLLQIIPPLPIARSMITGRLQDGSTVEPQGSSGDLEQRIDQINTARGYKGPDQGATKAETDDLDPAIIEAIAERIVEKADHFLRKPDDLNMVAPKRLITKVATDAGLELDMVETMDRIHERLKAVVARGKGTDWAVEDYADALRGKAKDVADHLELAAPVEPDPLPPPPEARLRRFVPERDVHGRILAIQEVLV